MADFAHPVRGRVITRRTFLVGLAGVAAGFVIRPLVAAAPGLASELTPSLLSAPLELGGVWKSSPADAVLRVLSRVRAVSLEGLRLLSDRQPDRLHVDNHPSGWPAVWLHNDHTNTAWIIVDIGPADWCKLSYQFGHELGHVLCNSWNEQSSLCGRCRLRCSNPRIPREFDQTIQGSWRTNVGRRNGLVVPRFPESARGQCAQRDRRSVHRPCRGRAGARQRLRRGPRRVESLAFAKRGSAGGL